MPQSWEVYSAASACVDRIKGELGESWHGQSRAVRMIASAFNGLNVNNKDGFYAICEAIDQNNRQLIINELQLNKEDFIEKYRKHIPIDSNVTLWSKIKRFLGKFFKDKT